MAASIINCNDPRQADVVLIGAPYEKTCSFGKGAAGGPDAIVNCLNTQVEFYERLTGTIPVNDLAVAYQPLARLMSVSPEAMVVILKAEYQLHDSKFRIVLGGEHSVTNAPLQVWAKDSAAITVLQIDAHADLRDDDSDYSDKPHGKYAHCAVMRRALELGYNLVQAGIRAYSHEEHELFQHERVKVFEWSGNKPTVDQIIAAIPTEKVYLSIDLDGLDPACLPATGTPVPGGLEWYYCLELIQKLCKERQVIAADIVELAPQPNDLLSPFAAAQVCYSLIGCWHHFTK